MDSCNLIGDANRGAVLDYTILWGSCVNLRGIVPVQVKRAARHQRLPDARQTKSTTHRATDTIYGGVAHVCWLVCGRGVFLLADVSVSNFIFTASDALLLQREEE